ncbi:hypothetical protein GCM10023114_41980 [Mycolicibacterium sediminis]|uniref:Uncharacterized protein n=1 Tax=Mycolicibacterium sediminis TaxID=1286180 RepID=A0A7I7QV11_9MYCO|nr:hypothetical protein MSEDJ_42940 [Mycolicibacterium sediminis]
MGAHVGERSLAPFEQRQDLLGFGDAVVRGEDERVVQPVRHGLLPFDDTIASANTVLDDGKGILRRCRGTFGPFRTGH